MQNHTADNSNNTDSQENEQQASPSSLLRSSDAPAADAANTEPQKPIRDRRERGGVSTPQMLKLMRMEMDRAQKHDYPISCIVIGLDSFEGEDDGDLRKAIMPAIFHELKLATFEADVRGLGTWSPTFQFAVFPHVKPEAIATLATDLMDRVRALKVDYKDETHRVTVSIGVSHNLRSGAMRFEDFLDDAEKGLRLAQSRGGNRCEMFAAAEESVDTIKEEIKVQAAAIRKQQQSYFEEKAGLEEKWGRELLEKIQATFHAEPQISEATIRLEDAVLKLVSEEVGALKESSALRALAESQSQIDNLERRVAKLTQSLDVTEKELKRVASMKNVDTGVASIYRSVQGISDEDDNAEQKKEMLQDLFDANIAFREELAAKA